jgi:WG repeat protein
MKRFLFFGLLLCLSCIAVGQDDLRVAFRDGLYGYIDRSGNFVIEPHFTEASGWEDGAARVELPDGKFAFIDSNGKYLMRPRQFDRLGYLSEGLALFEPKGAKYDTDGFVKNVGFIDVTGRVAIAPHLFAAYDFPKELPLQASSSTCAGTLISKGIS